MTEWPNDTIAAVSSPPGEGAIALVRLSGAEAVSIADRIFRAKQKPSEMASHFQLFGEVAEDERVVDLACGRGEFVELLADRGVDVERVAVVAARRRPRA